MQARRRRRVDRRVRSVHRDAGTPRRRDRRSVRCDLTRRCAGRQRRLGRRASRYGASDRASTTRSAARSTADELEALPQVAGLAALTDPTCRSGMVAASPNGAVRGRGRPDHGGNAAVQHHRRRNAARSCATQSGCRRGDRNRRRRQRRWSRWDARPESSRPTRSRMAPSAVGVRSTCESAANRSVRRRSRHVVASSSPGSPTRTSNQSPGRVVVWRLERMEPTSFAIDQHDIVGVAVLDAVASAIVVAGRDEPVGGVTVQLWDTASRAADVGTRLERPVRRV